MKVQKFPSLTHSLTIAKLEGGQIHNLLGLLTLGGHFAKVVPTMGFPRSAAVQSDGLLVLSLFEDLADRGRGSVVIHLDYDSNLRGF